MCAAASAAVKMEDTHTLLFFFFLQKLHIKMTISDDLLYSPKRCSKSSKMFRNREFRALQKMYSALLIKKAFQDIDVSHVTLMGQLVDYRKRSEELLLLLNLESMVSRSGMSRMQISANPLDMTSTHSRLVAAILMPLFCQINSIYIVCVAGNISREIFMLQRKSFSERESLVILLYGAGDSPLTLLRGHGSLVFSNTTHR